MTDSAVKNPVKELLTPSPDGVVTEFYTSSAYKTNSVSVWLNGIKLIPFFDDGFTTAGGTSTITMKEAPLTGDSLQAEYDAI